MPRDSYYQNDETEVRIEEGFRFYSDQFIKIDAVSKNFITVISDFVNADLHELLYEHDYEYVGPCIESSRHRNCFELIYRKIKLRD